MPHYGGDDGSWSTMVNAPTANQLAFIQELCEHLGYDYRIMVPDNFDEASEIIEELSDEAKWDYDRYGD